MSEWVSGSSKSSQQVSSQQEEVQKAMDQNILIFRKDKKTWLQLSEANN